MPRSPGQPPTKITAPSSCDATSAPPSVDNGAREFQPAVLLPRLLLPSGDEKNFRRRGTVQSRRQKARFAVARRIPDVSKKSSAYPARSTFVTEESCQYGSCDLSPIDLEGYDRAVPYLNRYVTSQLRYRRNALSIPARERDQVRHQWKRIFDELDYPAKATQPHTTHFRS